MPRDRRIAVSHLILRGAAVCGAPGCVSDAHQENGWQTVYQRVEAGKPHRRLASLTRCLTRLRSCVASPTCVPLRLNTRTLGTVRIPYWRVTGVSQLTMSILSRTTSGSDLANCSS